MRKFTATVERYVPCRTRAKAVIIETAVAVLAVIFVSCATEQRTAPLVDDPIGRAFASRASDVQVEGEGKVIRVLADDLDGSRHQRFIVQLASGQTLLLAHNIDIAPRIDGLEVGEHFLLELAPRIVQRRSVAVSKRLRPVQP